MSSCESSAGETMYDVIIVGAGLAGLSAAHTFLKNSIDNILIVEAQECIGGRVRQMRYENLSIDLGAQWIHGQKNNELYNFAAKYGLVSTRESTEGEGLFCTSGGEVIDPLLVDLVDATVSRVLFHEIMKDNDDVDSVLTRAEVESLRDANQDPNLVKGLFQWHRNYLLIDNSCQSLKDLSAKSWIEYEECQGPYCQLINEGFMSIIKQLAKDVSPEKILCNSPVTQICWDEKENDDIPVTVEIRNGRTLLSRHCLVTCSVGVLQRCHIFKPQLPSEYQKALNGIGFGTITKIFLIFDDPFWDENCHGIQLAWRPEEATNDWPKYMTGFDVFQSKDPAILIGWVGGNGAELLDSSDVSDEFVGERCVQLLKQFTRNLKIPNPVKTIRSKWMSNPYTMGAYSFRRAPFNTLLLDPITRQVGVDHQVPVLTFAGEAFHQDHYSTAHGAFESGRLQAMKIVQWRQPSQQ